MASVRAAFMEQTAAEIPALKGNRSAADQAFMIGILSLLENIYNISIDEIATSLNLSDEVRSALVERKGVFGRLLELTEMLESHEQAAAEGLQELGIPLDGVIAAQIRSLSRQQTPSGSGRGGK
jgi:EAL and modified HD-GYP domain-containing signal transduction protein